MSSKVVFATETYEPFISPICRRLDGSIRGEIVRKRFPDGELGLHLTTSVNDEDVILIGGTWNSADTLEIFDLGCAISKYGARSLTMVIPYYGCSTMERASRDGDVVTAKTRARLLSSIPQTHVGNHALLLDLHSEGIPYYFEGNLTATHVYGKSMIYDMVKGLAHRFGYEGRYVLASTDAGRAKWVESLSVDLGVPAAFIIKRRIDGATTKVLAVSADVRDKMVVLYDDMIRTGGSLIEAAKAYREAGAAIVCVVATHGLFVGGARDKMIQSGMFAHISVTDSHPNAGEVWGNDMFSVMPCAELFLPWLRKIG